MRRAIAVHGEAKRTMERSAEEGEEEEEVICLYRERFA